MLSLSADHVAAFTVWPHDAGHTTIVCDFLFHPDEMARAGFDPTDAVEFWDLVNRQDWTICEQVQDGMRSRKFTVRLPRSRWSSRAPMSGATSSPGSAVLPGLTGSQGARTPARRCRGPAPKAD